MSGIPTRLLGGDVIVEDGFYRDPDAVRRFALGLDYEASPAANFPGVESTRPYYGASHLRRFEALAGEPLVADPATWVFGKFRIARRGDAMRTVVHVDLVDWTGVVYLATGPHATGGLSFFRHRRLGIERVPQPEGLTALGCAGSRDFDRRHVFPVSRDPDCWEEIASVGLRYNRLVLFRGGRLFHGISSLFGHDRETGRLTQNFFMLTGAYRPCPEERACT